MVEKRNTVTILIPTYNRADYLSQTIESALNQTWTDVDVLIMDDASTDATPEVVASYAGNPRVRGIRHFGNLGMAGNWKAGVAEVPSDFFCLLNDDDLLEPQFVEKLIQPLLADPNLILAFSDHHLIDSEGNLQESGAREMRKHHHRDRLGTRVVADFGAAVALHRSLHISCTLFRAAMVSADFVDEKAGGFACGWMFYRCYRSGYAAYYVDEPLASYRIHLGNMLGNSRWETYLSEGQLYWSRQMLADDLPEPLRKRVRWETARIFSAYASARLHTGQHEIAGALYSDAYALRKSPKALLGMLLCKLGPLGTATIRGLRRLKQQIVSLQHPLCWMPLTCDQFLA